ncbi:unnamed protein product [Colias eurytheme]|nr:unnamed protein product [Colias eurytheme]
MSSGSDEEEIQTEVIYEGSVEESSVEDPPMTEWSSLIIEMPEENRKKVLHAQGLYKPGSGEICGKYIGMSQSSVIIHPYYNYPAVLDPGIKDALLKPEPRVVYPEDGQDLYLAVCREMNQCPVRMFHQGLVTDTIDLRYYSVNPYGVRPMALALQYNKNVTTFNLTDNFLNDDACFHLGDMLTSNSNLTELNLSGCRIGASGASKLFSGLLLNKKLRILNLDKNELGDLGIEHFAQVVFRGINLKQISLSKNNITGKSINTLAEAFETHNNLTHIDISRNNLSAPQNGIVNLLNQLAENKALQELHLSWDALSGVRTATAIKAVTRAPNLRVLDLSYNRLVGEAVETLIGSLGKAKKMVTLNLSNNPMTPEDALKVLNKMKSNAVKIQNLIMENVSVNITFLKVLNQIKSLKTKKNAVIVHGGVLGAYDIAGPDMRDLVLNRAEFLTKKGKKHKVDVALMAMQILKDNGEIMPTKEFVDAVAATGAPLDDDLVNEIASTFPGPKTAKTKTVDLASLVDFVKRKWPDRELPSTPPPEPEVQPEEETQPIEETENEPTKTQKKNKNTGFK